MTWFALALRLNCNLHDLIKLSVIWGVTALPLKRNLVQDLRREGEHKKRWRMYWTEDIGTVERRRTSQLLTQLFLWCMGDVSPCRIEWCFMVLLVLCFITRSSWSIIWSNAQNGKELSHIPMLMMTSSIRVRTSKLNRTLARSMMISFWMAG
jgi:hypothetical protein